jgi:hypothetical protein
MATKIELVKVIDFCKGDRYLVIENGFAVFSSSQKEEAVELFNDLTTGKRKTREVIASYELKSTEEKQ